MKSHSANINAILLLTLALLLTACKTTDPNKPGQEKAMLSFHLETNPDGSPRNYPVAVYRRSPMMVNVTRDPFMTHLNLEGARVVDVEGGFAIELKFTDHGARALQMLTVAQRGKRIAINCSFPELRWLGAPLITKTISDGVFIFTPDATREEAEYIVKGVNNVLKKATKNDLIK